MNKREYNKLKVGDFISILDWVTEDYSGVKVSPKMIGKYYPVLEKGTLRDNIVYIESKRGKTYAFYYEDIVIVTSLKKAVESYKKIMERSKGILFDSPLVLTEVVHDESILKRNFDEAETFELTEVTPPKVHCCDDNLRLRQLRGEERYYSGFGANKNLYIHTLDKLIANCPFCNEDRIFRLSKEQQEKLDKWYKKQKKAYYGAASGGLKFSFEPTGLGDIVTVSYNGKKLDLSDVDNW